MNSPLACMTNFNPLATPARDPFIGQPMLCADQIQDSYEYYKNSFTPTLNKLMTMFQSFTEDNFLKNNFHSYVQIDVSSLNAPKKMSLMRSFNLHNGALYKAGQRVYNNLSGCKKVLPEAKKIIQQWHLGKKIEKLSCEISAGEERDHKTHTFHVDQRVRALLNLPPQESPMIEGDTWVTTSGQLVRLHKVSLKDQKVIVSDLKFNERRKIPLEELSRPKQYSGQTTQIIPGLIVSPPKFDGENTFTYPEVDLTNHILMQTHFKKTTQTPLAAKLKKIIKMFNESSVAMPQGPFLIPVSKLMHGFPIGDHTPPAPPAKSISEFFARSKEQKKNHPYDRWLLTINYKVL